MTNTDYQYLLVTEVAELARASVDTVRGWLRSRRLPSVKPGRHRLVRRADFEAFMATDRLEERKQCLLPSDPERGPDGSPCE
jgi:excisionase family DNA binding protein